MSALTLALTTEDRERWRRWAVSLAAALALHGGVVAAVLSFRYAATSPTPPSAGGPFVIDLAPSEPAAPQDESRSASGGEFAARSRLPEQVSADGAPRRAEEKTAEKSGTAGEDKGEQKTAPAAAPPGLTAPAPSENAGAETPGDNRTASGGGGGGGVVALPGGGSMSGPIDTRITIVSPFGWRAKNKAARAGAPGPAKKSIGLLHPSKAPGASGSGHPGQSSEAGHPGQSSEAGHPGQTSAPSTAINAIGAQVTIGAQGTIGAHIQDRVRAALARAGGRNAGGGGPNNLGGGSARAAERTVTNAIGIATRFRPRLPGTAVGAQPAGAVAFAGNAKTMNGGSIAAINGTGMTRIGSGPGVIGGAARNFPGVINGTNFRPRHP